MKDVTDLIGQLEALTNIRPDVVLNPVTDYGEICKECESVR